jgi:hypothetical protein
MSEPANAVLPVTISAGSGLLLLGETAADPCSTAAERGVAVCVDASLVDARGRDCDESSLSADKLVIKPTGEPTALHGERLLDAMTEANPERHTTPGPSPFGHS